MTEDTDGYLVLKILPSLTYGVDGQQVLPTGWTDDRGYRRVPSLKNFTKSYVRHGRMTKDTDKDLVLRAPLIRTCKNCYEIDR